MSSGPAPGFAKHPGYEVKLQPAAGRHALFFNGQCVADSTEAVLVQETKHYPVVYFPAAAVPQAVLRATEHASHCPFKGDATYWDLAVGDEVLKNAVWAYPDPYDECDPIAGYYGFYLSRLSGYQIDGVEQPRIGPGYIKD